MSKSKSNKKLIKATFLNGNIYEFYSFQYGIYLEVNKIESCTYFDNMRCAMNWMYDYNEFVIGWD